MKYDYDDGDNEENGDNQGTPRLLVSVSSRWSLVLLGVRDQVSVPVSLTLKKRDRTRYRYRSLKKIETRLGLGIVNFKKTRPDSVSVSFTQKKNKTGLGLGIVHFQKTRPDSVSVSLKNGLGGKFTAKWIMKASY